MVKIYPSVKPICNKCKVTHRHGRAMVICESPCHKQRQGQSRSETQKPEPVASGCDPNQVKHLISRRVKLVVTLGIEGRGRESGG